MKSQKIAYVLSCFDTKNSGVFKKVFDQVTQWRSMGHIVQLFVITDRESRPCWQEIDPHAVTLLDTNLMKKILNRLRLISEAARTLPSVIYLRDIFPIRIPIVHIPIVIEVQTLVGPELRTRSHLRSCIFALAKRFHYRNLAGAIFTTSELMKLNEFRLPENLPKIAIGNAINLNRVEVLSARPTASPSLFFVGTPNQAWQGVSELVEFARANPDIQIELVGEHRESGLPNVKIHGFLASDVYRDIASKCVAAVGTMNLSVKQMKEASPLKVREYLAMGLPVILKYIDVDLNPEDDFVLQLPLDGRVMSDFSEEIRSFLDRWSNQRVSRSKINNLDVTAKEEIRLGFFYRVISDYSKADKRKGKR